MPAGLLIYNDHNTVLIDNEYQNLAVVSQGTQSNPPSYDGSNLTAIKATSLAHTSYSWWKFGNPVAPTGNAGLQVFDAAGNLTFDSRLKYARVIDVFTGPTTGTATHTYDAGRSYAVITAKRGWKTEQETRQDPDEPPGIQNYRRRFILARCYVSGASVIAGWHTGPWGNWSGPIQTPPAPPTNDSWAQYMVLDVTGY